MNIAGGKARGVHQLLRRSRNISLEMENCIIRDGTKKKFIRQIAQISFDSGVALDQGKDITYV